MRLTLRHVLCHVTSFNTCDGVKPCNDQHNQDGGVNWTTRLVKFRPGVCKTSTSPNISGGSLGQSGFQFSQSGLVHELQLFCDLSGGRSQHNVASSQEPQDSRLAEVVLPSCCIVHMGLRRPRPFSRLCGSPQSIPSYGRPDFDSFVVRG